jgi:glycerophosphoryl diester phosphodiesterase/endonuclease/exonuclease/phosphatase family metal-dependent hydrolase
MKSFIYLTLVYFFMLNPIFQTIHAADSTLIVMTFNIKNRYEEPPNDWQSRLPKIKDVIEDHAPHVFGVQEAFYNQVKDLDETLPGYEWIGLGRDGGSRNEFMAVYFNTERLQPLEFDHFWLSDSPMTMGSATWGNTNRRMVTWVKFRDKQFSREFIFINTHFDHRVELARVNSAFLIDKKVRDFKSQIPVILVGDFNATAEQHPAYDILTKAAAFEDSWTQATERLGEGLDTFNGFRYGPHDGGRRIDWILARGPVKAQKAIIDNRDYDGHYPSDHFPVIAHYSYRAEPGPRVYFQAHRGAVDEAPENTLAALQHAWSIPGAIPEIDVRQTVDGVLVVLHDETLERTVSDSAEWISQPVSQLTWSQISELDVGSHFDVSFKGEKIPRLEQVLQMMQEDSGRQLYIDLKGEIDSETLQRLINATGIESRLIFVHGDIAELRRLKAKYLLSRTMTWLSGADSKIKQQFETLNEQAFAGIDQLQFHLYGHEEHGVIVYDLEDEWLHYAFKVLAEQGLVLEVRPFIFSPASLEKLRSLGIRWYVTDAPQAFHKALSKASDR